MGGRAARSPRRTHSPLMRRQFLAPMAATAVRSTASSEADQRPVPAGVAAEPEELTRLAGVLTLARLAGESRTDTRSCWSTPPSSENPTGAVGFTLGARWGDDTWNRRQRGDCETTSRLGAKERFNSQA